MIAITGANGQLGRLVINSLLEKTDAANIVALVRNPEKASDLKALGVSVRRADYDQPETLTNALDGINKLLLISGSEIGQRTAQHQAVIQAALAVKVELLAYTSLLKANTSPLALAAEHKQTEEAINTSGLPAVILRNGWYTENYTQSIAGVLESRTVVGATQNGYLHTAARKDYAEAAAVVLTTKDNQAGKVYELAGDRGFTLKEYAAEIAKQSGENIQYQALNQQELTQLFISVGVPEGFAILLVDAEIHAANGWLAEDSHTLSRLIGRATTPWSDTVKEALSI